MKVTWIGQAGLLIEMNGLQIMVDPYLSDCVEKVNPASYRRKPVDTALFDVEPDVMLFTHDHIDHYDPETAPIYLQKTHPMLVLAPGTCWNKARAFKGPHNYVLFDRGTQWTEKGVRFTAVKAVHSDPYAIGIIIEGEGKCLYITGDTLYNPAIFEDLPENIDAMFVPINGVGNNTNPVDAARLAEGSGAKVAVPVHWGMFDEIDPKVFAFEPKIIPEIYREVKL